MSTPATEKQVSTTLVLAERFHRLYESNLHKMFRVQSDASGVPAFVSKGQAQVVIGKAVAVEHIIYADGQTVRQVIEILKAAKQKATAAATKENQPVSAK